MTESFIRTKSPPGELMPFWPLSSATARSSVTPKPLTPMPVFRTLRTATSSRRQWSPVMTAAFWPCLRLSAVDGQALDDDPPLPLATNADVRPLASSTEPGSKWNVIGRSLVPSLETWTDS